MSVNDNISVNDLNEEDFTDPITLLDAIRRLNLQAISGPETPKEKTLLSVENLHSKKIWPVGGVYSFSDISRGNMPRENGFVFYRGRCSSNSRKV